MVIRIGIYNIRITIHRDIIIAIAICLFILKAIYFHYEFTSRKHQNKNEGVRLNTV
jgi:hypothetical protein